MTMNYHSVPFYPKLMDKEIVIMKSDRSHSFASFNTWDDFYDYLLKIDKKERCFHETITEGLQKFRLDIDYNKRISDKEWKQSLNIISYAINVLFNTYHLVPNIKLMEAKGNFKRSAHIVITNYCFKSSKVCMFLCQRIINMIPNLQSTMIDTGVFSKTQFFRIQGCTKYQDYRPLLPYPSSKEELFEGLITHLVNTKYVDIPIYPIKIKWNNISGF